MGHLNRTMCVKRLEILYSINARKFIKRTLCYKVPPEIVTEILKYTGFNIIKFNPYNLIYKYNINQELETDLT